MATVSANEEETAEAVIVPHEDVQQMMNQHIPPTKVKYCVGDFVEILTGEVSRYHGNITRVTKREITIEVNFPTGRQFIVTADPTCIRLVPNVPTEQQAFWGVRLNSTISVD